MPDIDLLLANKIRECQQGTIILMSIVEYIYSMKEKENTKSFNGASCIAEIQFAISSSQKEIQIRVRIFT